MRNGKVKGRSSITYKHKLDRLKSWYAKRETDYALAIKEGKKIKELKPLEFYIEKLKKPNTQSKNNSISTKKTKECWY